MRDPLYNESVAKGYDIHELLKVSRRYRAGGAEDEANREQAPPATASTASTSSTGTANPLEKQGKNDGKNVDADVDVDDARKTARVNRITGKRVDVRQFCMQRLRLHQRLQNRHP